MSKFDDTKRKVRETFRRIREERSDILNKSNTKEKLKAQQEKFKTPGVLYDSDWIGVSPAVSPFSVTQKSDLVPVTFNYQFDEDDPLPGIQVPIVSELPEELLGFVDPIVLVKGIPGTEFKAQADFTFSQWGSENYEVRGDGGLIYKGLFREVNGNFSQDDLDNGNFPEENTKQRWNVRYEYSFGGEHFRIVGDLARIQFIDDLGIVCGSLPDLDRYDCSLDPEVTTVDNEHRLTEVKDFNGTGLGMNLSFKLDPCDLFETRFTTNPSPPPDCFQNITQTENVTVTKNFSTVDRYIIQFALNTTKFKLDAPGGNPLSSEGFGLGEIDSETDIDTDNDIEVVQLGYFLYWSSQTRWLFGLVDTLVPDGDFTEVEPDNLPELVFPNETATLPYTTINYQRNPGDFPVSEEFPSSSQGQRKFLWLRTSKSNATTPRHQLKLEGIALALAPATEEFSDTMYPTYNDNYTQGGSPLTYELTDENHSLKSRKTYKSKGEDVQVRLILALKNPLYWEEMRRYLND